jgi:hypothetical protein
VLDESTDGFRVSREIRLAAPFAERLEYRSVRFLRPQGVRRVRALRHPLPFPQALQRRDRLWFGTA